VLDLWKARSAKPTPLVIHIHGGGFRGGDKRTLSPILLQRCLESGISVASINYRLSQHAIYPAPFLDSAYAVQFLRSKAAQWNLDPKRFGATGGSAGAGISLWIGFHDDLAEPASADPVKRQSTRLAAVAVVGAQTTYDPREIRKIIGEAAARHPALPLLFGISPEDTFTDKADKLYRDSAAVTHLSADDPPVYLLYQEPRGPVPADAPPGTGIHHPAFGTYLKERMDKLGIECIVRHQDDFNGQPKGQFHIDMADFFRRHFGLK
jgi:acetyl esterase/lipase